VEIYQAKNWTLYESIFDKAIAHKGIYKANYVNKEKTIYYSDP